MVFPFRKTLGRDMKWEQVQQLMRPARTGVPATAGIFSCAIMAMTKSRQWALALELEKVRADVPQ